MKYILGFILVFSLSSICACSFCAFDNTTKEETILQPDETVVQLTDVVLESNIKESTTVEEKTEESTIEASTQIELNKFQYIWLGDSRTVDIQETIVDENDNYCAKDGAAYEWFVETCKNYLNACSKDELYQCIILMGVNDCFISKQTPSYFAADLYANTINDWITTYPNIMFYVCSVMPCDSQHISINAEITRFNGVIKSKCNAVYLNVNNLIKNFITVDGLHYDTTTSMLIHEIIKTLINEIQFQKENN